MTTTSRVQELQHVTLCTQDASSEVVVVAVGTMTDGEIRDWAAYAGVWLEGWDFGQTRQDIADHGCKLYAEEACAFFPQLPQDKYRR